MSTTAHTTGAQNANRHRVSKKAGTSATRSANDSSSSTRSFDVSAAITTTSALTIARTTSVGRRDLGSSCAEANICSPSVRLANGRTTVRGLAIRGC